MKTRLAKILMLISVLATAALADDAAIKKQFVGYWNSPGSDGVWHLTEDGRMHLNPEPSTPWTWTVQDGVFKFSKGPTGSTQSFTIVSLTKSKFVLKDHAHGTHTATWIRIGTAPN